MLKTFGVNLADFNKSSLSASPKFFFLHFFKITIFFLYIFAILQKK